MQYLHLMLPAEGCYIQCTHATSTIVKVTPTSPASRFSSFQFLGSIPAFLIHRLYTTKTLVTAQPSFPPYL